MVQHSNSRLQPAPEPAESRGTKRRNETAEEKQERIRQRNRDHARRCRIRKRQAAENLAQKASKLEHENSVLKTAFRALHNQKSLMESFVISEFGERGYTIVEKSRQVKVLDQCSIGQLCQDFLGEMKKEESQLSRQHTSTDAMSSRQQ